MKAAVPGAISEQPLPWSDGLLSARIWQVGTRCVACVPELGLHCYGQSESEAVFRLFTALLKYYRQLNTYQENVSQRALEHLSLLRVWVQALERRMIAPASVGTVVPLR